MGPLYFFVLVYSLLGLGRRSVVSLFHAIFLFTLPSGCPYNWPFAMESWYPQGVSWDWLVKRKELL